MDGAPRQPFQGRPGSGAGMGRGFEPSCRRVRGDPQITLQCNNFGRGSPVPAIQARACEPPKKEAATLPRRPLSLGRKRPRRAYAAGHAAPQQYRGGGLVLQGFSGSNPPLPAQAALCGVAVGTESCPSAENKSIE